MNAPHTYGGNVAQLGRTIDMLHAERDRILAANYSRGPQFVPEAPMAIDVPHIEDSPTVAPRRMARPANDGWLSGYRIGFATGAAMALLIAVAVL